MGKVHPAAHELRQGQTVHYLDDVLANFGVRPELYRHFLNSRRTPLPDPQYRIDKMSVSRLREVFDYMPGHAKAFYWSRKRAIKRHEAAVIRWANGRREHYAKRGCVWSEDGTVHQVVPWTREERTAENVGN